MSLRHRIAIVGCGIAGAALAIQLGRRGHHVEVFERRPSDAGGGGLLLAPAALAHLRMLGLEEEMRAHGKLISTLHSTRADGALLLRWDARRLRQDYLGLAVSRRVLHGALVREALQVASLRFELGVLDVQAEEGCITDERGEQRGPFDLVVASDGAASRLRSTRTALLRRSQRYEWTALCCLVRRAGGRAGEVANMRQWFDGPNHLSIWPVGRGDDNSSLLCVAVNVPPESVPCFAAIDTGFAELRRLGFASGLEALQPVGPWISLACRHVEMRRCFDGRLVFLGDAAHSLSPQLGQGARLALAGAQNLTESIDRRASLHEAIPEYDRRQRALARRYQRWSRWITPIFQSRSRGSQWLRDRVLPIVGRLTPMERGLTRWLWGEVGSLVPGQRSFGAGEGMAEH